MSLYSTQQGDNSMRIFVTTALCSGLMSFSSNVFAQEDKTVFTLEEIVVTSRKREESLQDVPVAVTALTENTLTAARIKRPSDFLGMVPNVTLSDAQDSGNVAINIRGVGQIRNGETPVAIAVDGVLQSSPIQFNQEFFDIQQIEVLRGPQGALYGRNAIAGAINITTKRPTNELSGKAQAGYGNGNLFNASAAVSGALIEDILLVRMGLSHKQSDGLITNSFLNEKVDHFEDTSARLRLDWQITDSLNADIRGFYAKRSGGAAYFARPLLQASGKPFIDGAAVVDVANDVVAPESNNPGFDKRELLDFSLKLEHESDAGTITSITSYSNVDHLVAFDGYDYADNTQCYLFGWSMVTDGLTDCNNPQTLGLGASGDPDGDDILFPASYNTTFQDNSIENWSQELRFTSPDNRRLRYIVGLYGLWRDRSLVTGTNEDLGFGIIPQLDFNPNTLNETRRYFAEQNDDFAYAIFGQFNYDISDDLELTVSGRYDKDKRKQTDPRPDGRRVDGFGLPITGNATREASFSSFQPKVSLRWSASESINIYANYAQGFRSGGFNAPGTEVNPFTGDPIADSIYGKEQTRGFELGFKSRLNDQGLILNGAVFYTDADDLQVFNFNGAVNAQIVTTLDDVDIWGAELEMIWAVSPSLDLFGGFGYNDAEIKASAANPAAVGNQVPYTTKWSLNLGAQHEASLSDSLTLVSRVDWEHRGKTYFHEGGTFVGIPTRNELDFVSARIAIEHSNGWSLSIWGKNLLDKIYYEEVVAPDYNYQGRPRTFGMELSINF
ncbi:TonB-dependent receptor [Paremcibacter congregatus]|uniref:TonB-dependent receptor n=1 Tax=Paremcibacter congregatus TaxID=2043170 RepID=UPI003A94622F